MQTDGQTETEIQIATDVDKRAKCCTLADLQIIR